jgi:lipid II:glycine glycyltransferase (peptidoglycan interpeptide bridge formation enzyme)
MDRISFNKVAGHPLQSWEWGEFRKATGNDVQRFPFGQITLHTIAPTNFKIGAFIKGPAPTKTMLDELKASAKKEKIIFIKLEPNVVKDEKIIKLLEKNGAVRGKTLFTPTTFWIDLTISEEDLLKSFHSKTRYNIRLAQRNGVEIVEDNSDKAFEKYISLTRETVDRQGFYAHTEKYHRLMWEHFHQSPITNHQPPIARLLTARYKREIITCWIIFVWKDVLYYPYGASTEKYKEVMANNLMLWEAIRFGKSLGLKTFDLWGREEGKGFTKFKEGYNPKVVEFLGTWDFVINKPFYWVYRVAETLRWLLLRLKANSGLFKNTF